MNTKSVKSLKFIIISEFDWVAPFLIIFVATLFRLSTISTLDLTDGEAYYALWAKVPALSYYDHPPMIAWLGTLLSSIFPGAFGVRVGPVIFSALFDYLMYRLGSILFSRRAGLYSLVIVSMLPIFAGSSIILNPEYLLRTFWVLALLALFGMKEHEETWRPYLLAFWVGIAFLAKYTAVLLLPVSLIYMIVSPPMRRWLTRSSLYLSSLMALAIASPVLIWNQRYGWPTLSLHLVERLSNPVQNNLFHKAIAVLWGQLAGYHPFIFPSLLGALIFSIYKSRVQESYQFLVCVSLPVLAFCFFIMIKVPDSEPHWSMVGVIPLIVAAAGWLSEKPVFGKPLRYYFTLCATTTLFVVAVSIAHAGNQILAGLLPASFYKPTTDPIVETVAWDEVREIILKGVSELGLSAVVASCQYALCAHLEFVLQDNPSVYCPSIRRTEYDFIGRKIPPFDVPVLYVNNDHYDEAPEKLLPQWKCKPYTSIAIERQGVALQHYYFFKCLPL